MRNMQVPDPGQRADIVSICNILCVYVCEGEPDIVRETEGGLNETFNFIAASSTAYEFSANSLIVFCTSRAQTHYDDTAAG